MRVLVIGASGFLGAHVRHRACAAGMQVVTAGRSGLPGSPGHQRVDLAADDPARIAALLTDVDPGAVVNCAGVTSGDPDTMAAANVGGTYALVTAMILAGTEARLVHLGSASQYGPTPRVFPWPSGPPQAGMYGVTKLAGRTPAGGTGRRGRARHCGAAGVRSGSARACRRAAFPGGGWPLSCAGPSPAAPKFRLGPVDAVRGLRRRT